MTLSLFYLQRVLMSFILLSIYLCLFPHMSDLMHYIYLNTSNFTNKINRNLGLIINEILSHINFICKFNIFRNFIRKSCRFMIVVI